MTRIIVVDENDKEIGLKERSEVTKNEISRKSVLWVTNPKGEVLLSKRGAKKNVPLRWSAAVAGTVDEGEDYVSNILKEAKEEIGIDLTSADIKLVRKVRVKNEFSNHYATWFSCVVDKEISEFVLEPEEVIGLRWIEPAQLTKEIAENPESFVPTAPLFKELGFIS